MDLNTNQGEIRYLTPLDINTNSKKKYCRFKRLGIKYIDYKDSDYLLKFVGQKQFFNNYLQNKLIFNYKDQYQHLV